MRELLLLRHGKALRAEGHDDIDRPLKDAGKRAVQRIGVWLARHELLPDHVITSPAERAATSAAKCVKAMQLDARRIVTDARIYNATRDDLLRALADCPPDVARVLLVGHNPGLRKLIRHLTSGDGRVDRLRKGAMVHLRMPDDWTRLGAGQGELAGHIDPADLPKKFPFPSPHGGELRDRPAYYYTQSSVLPYRLGDDDALEILIVRSSQNKHWVVPKGIADPGHSLQSSAAKEAWEEAGVIGDVDEDAIGSYRYQKWGATCSVTLYPMRVNRVIPDDEWQERHRGRQWVSARVAAILVRQPEVGEMITAFARRFGDA